MNTEELIKLADLLDAREEHDAAGEIDAYLRKLAEDPETVPADPTMKVEEDDATKELGEGEALLPGEYESEYKETMEMKPEPEPADEDALRSALDRFLESPRRFDNVHQLKQMIDDYVLSAVPKEAALKDVFTKLANIADGLDTEGQSEAANMIDGFLGKYAADYPEHPDMPDEDESVLGPGVQGEVGDLGEELRELEAPDTPGANEAARQQQGRGIDKDAHEAVNRIENELMSLRAELHGLRHHLPEELDVMSEELDEVAAKYMVAADEYMSKKEANRVYSSLSKHADDVMDWKEEGDTEQSKRYDDRHHHNLQVREPKRDQERVDREGRKEHHVSTYKPHEGSLSTRHCPTHIGEQLGRVGPSTYQCPRDGAIFNFETGYTTFDGVNVPGGSVAGQTPDSTEYAIPHRVFDSRDKVLNTIN